MELHKDLKLLNSEIRKKLPGTLDHLTKLHEPKNFLLKVSKSSLLKSKKRLLSRTTDQVGQTNKTVFLWTKNIANPVNFKILWLTDKV